ncbi:hypothetical protein OGATHE_001741 [Ogataea polymorpha]|uniref:Uncharacterized protein n=1 Tax=Ogataea polymorpha TaxID=460523 RepID=A0A9P8PNP0_9ASCO|nr:hypothetical protein OGATHE_001741 [Ogataea polymorpha]
MILSPEANTDPNRNVVIPPSTAFGIATNAAANLEKTPITMSFLITFGAVRIPETMRPQETRYCWSASERFADEAIDNGGAITPPNIANAC